MTVSRRLHRGVDVPIRPNADASSSSSSLESSPSPSPSRGMYRTRLSFQPKPEPTLSKNEVDMYLALLDNDRLESQNQEARRPNIPSHTSVVVVGAGLAGLAAAREFVKAGIDVVILEATDRVGGRCWTVSSPTFSKGVYAEAGGMRFPGHHKILNQYLDLFGLEKIPFTNMKDKNGLLFFNDTGTPTQEELNNPDSVLARVVEKWNESICPLRTAWSMQAISWEDLIKQYSDMSVLDFLHHSEWSDELVDGFAKYGLGLGAYGAILHLSFLEILRLFMESYECGNYQLKGGMENLVWRFLLDEKYPLQCAVRYGCKVTSVTQRADGRHEVHYDSNRGGSSLKLACDFVVITCPLPALAKVSFDPPLEPEVYDAINDSHYVRAVKVILQTKRPFWLDHGVDGTMISDMDIQNTYFAPPFPDSEKGLVIASYVWEKQAEIFFNLSNEDKVKKAVDDLSKAFPEMNDMFERGFAVEWNDAFCIYRPGQMKKHQTVLRDEICPNVFLAGEHCSVEHGYFEGALESGLRAATNVFGCIDEGFQNDLERKMFHEHSLGSFQLRKTSFQVPQRRSSSTISMLSSLQNSPKIPKIFLKRLDHYTLICDDAKAVSDFHVNALGFKFLRIQKVNTGTVVPEDFDMLNYILSPPENTGIVMVVTEGLNDRTIFRKYMQKYGPGVHHVAFEVDNVDEAFSIAMERGIQTTSDHVTTDMLSGLKQFFIDPSHAGFFIEVIERPKEKPDRDATPQETSSDGRPGFFTSDNMAELALSIGKYVDDGKKPQDDTESTCSLTDHSASHSSTDFGYSSATLTQAMKKVPIGEIRGIAFRVPSTDASARFLQESFNFRHIRYQDNGDRVVLNLSATNSSIPIIIERAVLPSDERKATVYFTASSAQQTLQDDPCLSLFEKCHFMSSPALRLPSDYASYNVLLSDEEALSSLSREVRSNGTELYVDIGTSQEKILDFLLDPANLTKWTGHRAIHFSRTKNEWVETRLCPEGSFADFVLKVEQLGESMVIFQWPERNVSVKFECLVLSDNVSCLVVKMPSSIAENRLASMKRVIMLELAILKSLLEDDHTMSSVPDRAYQHIQAYHLNTYGMVIPHKLSSSAADEFGFHGEVLRDGELYNKMSTDFAQTIHSQPLAILRPKSIQDVRAALRMAQELHIPLAARGSIVSHSAGGQAQADNGLVLDLSPLCHIEYKGARAVRVGAGCMWHDVVRKSLDRGLMPPVVNDYQYLSVGGTISMGGVGFMSHQEGTQAGHVNELEVVTGMGDLMVCSPTVNRNLFDHCRGGLGQMGVVTSLTIPLVPAPKRIAIFKIFYKQEDGDIFCNDMDMLVKDGRVEMIHAFLKPCTPGSLSKMIGKEATASTSDDFQKSFDHAEDARRVVFFLELGCYLWRDDDGDDQDPESNDVHLSNIRQFLANSLRGMSGEIVEEHLDFYAYITRDPPVVKTNQEHGAIPHPSFATLLDPLNAMDLIRSHLASEHRGEDATNEILMIPVKTNETVQRGHHVPLFPVPESSSASWSMFMLFLGSVLKPSDAESLATHQRMLSTEALSKGGRRYSYDTITHDTKGEDAWKAHFGTTTWHRLCQAKRQYDPFHTLAPGVPMWG